MMRGPPPWQVWRVQLKRIRSWCVRIFFAATVGFAVPITRMGSSFTVLAGLLLGIIGGILAKFVRCHPHHDCTLLAPDRSPSSARRAFPAPPTFMQPCCPTRPPSPRRLLPAFARGRCRHSRCAIARVPRARSSRRRARRA